MTVGELKEYLDKFDDRAEVSFYDHYTIEVFPLEEDDLIIEDKFEDLEESDYEDNKSNW